MIKFNQFNKIIAVLTAVSSVGAYAAAVSITASAETVSAAPSAEMGIRIAPESAAGAIVTEGNLGSGIASGSEDEGWTVVTEIGEGTDGRASARYDMKTEDEITAEVEKNDSYTYTVELGYGQSKRFALIEQYTISDLERAEQLDFTYYSSKTTTDNIGIWLYDGEMPDGCSVNETGEERANTVIQNLAKTYGIYSGNSADTDATVTTAEAVLPLARTSGGVEENAAYTITVNGDALDTLKAAASYDDDGNGTFVITVNNVNLKGNSTAKIYMKVKDGERDTDPAVTATYGTKEISDAPDGAVVFTDAVTNSTTAAKSFDVDADSHISAAATTKNDDIWYIGDYDISDISGFTVKAIMCPGTETGEDGTETTVTPAVNIAYTDITEGETVDAQYISDNSKNIRAAKMKIASYSGTTTDNSDSSDYADFNEISIDNTSEISGTKHVFVYGTANKARIYLDYISILGAKLADYPTGAVGVYNTGVVTNYAGKYAKAYITEDTYRNVTDYNNANDKMWYLGTYTLGTVESIEISASLGSETGEDGNTYTAAAKLSYMPYDGTTVDADYLDTNSKTIRSAKNTIYTWNEATDGLTAKTVSAADLSAADTSQVELFVYGTTQYKYTYTDADNAEASGTAKPTLGLDYVKINVTSPEGAAALKASDDMQLRTANTTDYRTTSVMELKMTDTERYAFTGAMKFDISSITSYVRSGYRVKSAQLRLTTMKRNNSSEIMAVPFTTDFGESYGKDDVLGDELIDTVKYVIENSKSYTVGSLACAMSGKNLNDYATLTDGTNTDTDLSSWYNTTDITEYLGGAAKGGAAELPILLYSASETDTTGNQICTKDIENDKNWETVSAFYTLDGNAVTAADFAPTLIVELEAGEETADTVEVLTTRIHKNRVVLKGGYDYLAWKCDKDVTDKGATVTAGSPLYSVKRVLDDIANADLGLTAADFTLDTFYITGDAVTFIDGAANTKTNPYVDAEGNVTNAEVAEYVNTVELSDDLAESGKDVYLAAYGADGTLKNVAVYTAAQTIEIPSDDNGEGFKVEQGDTLKVFVWDGDQTAVYTK